MPRPSLACLLILAAAGACRMEPPRPAGAARASVVVEEAEAWRRVASARDSAALEGLAGRWQQALAAGRAAGAGRRIAAEGALLAADSALPRAAPAPGSYRCRYVRPGGRKWAASASGFCYVGVEGGQLSLATELRGLRLGGYLWELKDGSGLIFLGAPVTGGRTAPAYGDDPARDVVGRLERIGEFRYRLALPGSGPGAEFTVVELVAAPRT